MQAPVLSIRNGRRSVVITGTPEQLNRFELYCEKITEKEEADRKAKVRGGAVFRPVFNRILTEVGFHTPRLSGAIDLVEEWVARCPGIDPELGRWAAHKIFVEPVDWVAQVEELHQAGAKWLVDLGPGDVATRVTAPVIRGLGTTGVVGVVKGGDSPRAIGLRAAAGALRMLDYPDRGPVA